MEDFVSYDIAVKLKEKGFKGLCFAYYTNTNDLYFNYSHKAGAKYSDCYLSHNLMPKDSVIGKFVDAHTISQILKWLRENHATHIEISLGGNGWYFEITQYEYNEEEKEYDCKLITISVINDSYEQAALSGIEYVIDNLI